jgi:hypothetical protein
MPNDKKDLLTRYTEWNYSRHGNQEPANDSQNGGVVKLANQDRKTKANDPYKDTLWFLPGAYNPNQSTRQFTVDPGINQLFIVVAASHGITTELKDSTGDSETVLSNLKKYVGCVDKRWSSKGILVTDPTGTEVDKNSDLNAPELSDPVNVQLNAGDQYLTSIGQQAAYTGPMLTRGRVCVLDIDKEGQWTISIGCTSPGGGTCGKSQDLRYTINLTYTVTVPRKAP